MQYLDKRCWCFTQRLLANKFKCAPVAENYSLAFIDKDDIIRSYFKFKRMAVFLKVIWMNDKVE